MDQELVRFPNIGAPNAVQQTIDEATRISLSSIRSAQLIAYAILANNSFLLGLRICEVLIVASVLYVWFTSNGPHNPQRYMPSEPPREPLDHIPAEPQPPTPRSVLLFRLKESERTITKLKIKLEESEQREKQLQKTNNNLESVLRAYEEHHQDLKDIAQNAQFESGSYRAELKACRTKEAQLQKVSTELENETASLREKVAQLETSANQVQTLQNSIHQLQVRETAHTERIKELEEKTLNYELQMWTIPPPPIRVIESSSDILEGSPLSAPAECTASSPSSPGLCPLDPVPTAPIILQHYLSPPASTPSNPSPAGSDSSGSEL